MNFAVSSASQHGKRELTPPIALKLPSQLACADENLKRISSSLPPPPSLQAASAAFLF
ncbi:MAG: hypothetical protein JSR16_10045 [Proteobacteria bacterium]|nr:hypothetical protein [Pseudomonadota bacterium]